MYFKTDIFIILKWLFARMYVYIFLAQHNAPRIQYRFSKLSTLHNFGMCAARISCYTTEFNGISAVCTCATHWERAFNLNFANKISFKEAYTHLKSFIYICFWLDLARIRRSLILNTDAAPTTRTYIFFNQTFVSQQQKDYYTTIRRRRTFVRSRQEIYSKMCIFFNWREP